ncbi:MAG TPA: hypothetical protein VJ546_12540 [Bacillales bacterium]|nr:hypothetical protein [Bacillales bacterium]
MDHNLEQTFEIRYLKIGIIANDGALQIGAGGGSVLRGKPAGYTTIGETTVGLLTPPSVLLQSPVRNLKGCC